MQAGPRISEGCSIGRCPCLIGGRFVFAGRWERLAPSVAAVIATASLLSCEKMSPAKQPSGPSELVDAVNAGQLRLSSEAGRLVTVNTPGAPQVLWIVASPYGIDDPWLAANTTLEASDRSKLVAASNGVENVLIAKLVGPSVESTEWLGPDFGLDARAVVLRPGDMLDVRVVAAGRPFRLVPAK